MKSNIAVEAVVEKDVDENVEVTADLETVDEELASKIVDDWHVDDNLSSGSGELDVDSSCTIASVEVFSSSLSPYFANCVNKIDE